LWGGLNSTVPEPAEGYERVQFDYFNLAFRLPELLATGEGGGLYGAEHFYPHLLIDTGRLKVVKSPFGRLQSIF